MAVVLGLAGNTTALAPYAPPPMYRIRASSLYDAGLQQGQLARDRIRGWLASPEMTALLNYTVTDGASVFAELKETNTAEHSELVAELEGLAAGADVPLGSVWAATLINELESLRTNPLPAGHCSDLYAVADSGAKYHGHNEDWPGPIRDFWYFVSYTPLPGANFSAVAGAVYPGGLVGWASSWNAAGIYFTQNSLFPRKNVPGGVASAFAQRAALCGTGSGVAGHSAAATTLDEFASRLVAKPWSSAASLNIVSLRENRMANVEVHLGLHARHDVAADLGRSANYSHFNMFKTLEVGLADAPEPSTVHRQARVDALPPVRDMADIAERLSDDHDRQYPIYRDMTLHTLVLDGASGVLQGWCCGRRAAVDPPDYHWDLSSFFGQSKLES
jgi:hypothetical protein